MDGVAELVDEFGEDRRDGTDHAARPGGTFAEDQGVADHVDAAAAGQRGEDLEHRHVEVDRGAGQHPGTLAGADAGGELGDPVDDGGVAEHDTLGGAGGAGGVHHVRQVLRVRRRPAGAVGPRVVVEIEVVEVQVRDVAGRQDAGRRGVGDDELRSGLGEDELEAVAGVLGVDGQVAGAGLENAEHGHDQVGGAGQRQADDGFGAGAAQREFAGQALGAGVERAVGQVLPVAVDGDGVRGAGRLLGEQGGQRQVGRRGGGVAEFGEQVVAFGRGEDVDLGDAGLRVVGEVPEDPLEAGGDGLDGGGVEEVVLVLQGHPQPRFGGGGHDHRVVGAAHRADAGDGDARCRVGVGDAGPVDRVGVEDDDGVEEGLQAGGVVDLGQAVVLVVQQGALPVLQAGEDLLQGVGGGAVDPDGQGVDEQSDHGVDARYLRRAAGDGGAEHHVTAAGQAAQRQSPGRLDDGVEGDAQFGGPACEVGGRLGGQGDVDLADAGRGRPGLGVRHDQGGFVDAREFGGPGAGRLLAVLLVQPDQEVAVAADPGQGGGVAGGGVQPQQVLQQQRYRPAVEQDVVGGEHQLGPVTAHGDQRHPQHGGCAGVEVGGVVLGQQ